MYGPGEKYGVTVTRLGTADANRAANASLDAGVRQHNELADGWIGRLQPEQCRFDLVDIKVRHGHLLLTTKPMRGDLPRCKSVSRTHFELSRGRAKGKRWVYLHAVPGAA